MKFFRRLRALFRKEELDQELSDELAFHLEKQIEQNIGLGMSAQEARYAPLRSFGGVEQVKEECRDAWGVRSINTLLQDLRFGLRMLAKNPGFTTVAVLTLALGIGANTAIFSLVNGCLIRPMPVPAPEQLAVLAVSQQGAPLGALGFSYPEFSEFREQSETFCEVIGQRLALVPLSVDGRTDQVPMSGVTSNYFSVLQVKPALGRLVLPSDGEGGGSPGVLVLSYSYWQRRFGGDPGVVGKQVRVEGRPATIIGVVSKEFGTTSILEMDAYVSLGTLILRVSGTASGPTATCG